MLWAFDIDGVITANPECLRWLIYHLTKNGHEVVIVTSRNPKREFETHIELERLGIDYEKIYFMPKNLPRDFTTQAKWKVETIKRIKPNVWMDNNFKIYEKALGVDCRVKGVERVEV